MIWQKIAAQFSNPNAVSHRASFTTTTAAFYLYIVQQGFHTHKWNGYSCAMVMVSRLKQLLKMNECIFLCKSFRIKYVYSLYIVRVLFIHTLSRCSGAWDMGRAWYVTEKVTQQPFLPFFLLLLFFKVVETDDLYMSWILLNAIGLPLLPLNRH